MSNEVKLLKIITLSPKKSNYDKIETFETLQSNEDIEK